MPSVGLVFRSQRVSILLFCAATFFFWASLYLYVPVLPVYAKSLGASLSMVGAVISSYAIAQLVLRIPIGLFADILGKRKPLVVAGIVASAVGALGLGLAPSPWPLFLARAATGVGAATWVVFPVLFASYYPREQAMRAIGIISFVNGAAIVVATYAGGVIAQLWGFAPVFFGAVSLGVMGLVAVLPAKEPVVQRTRPVSWGGFVRVATHPLLLTVSGISILLHFVIFSGVFGFIPVYAEKIGASRADLGVMTMLSMGSGALASLGVAYMAERWG
ncbi:MAG: MFS transporter, partial [Chloroflexi bacterium]|nr:MFS transporter [Chloroflexota bacterium]